MREVRRDVTKVAPGETFRALRRCRFETRVQDRLRTAAACRSPDTSTAEGREPDAQIAHGEAVQVPGAPARDLLGLGSEKPGELPLEAQPRVLLDDALADGIPVSVSMSPDGREPRSRRRDYEAGTACPSSSRKRVAAAGAAPPRVLLNWTRTDPASSAMCSARALISASSSSL